MTRPFQFRLERVRALRERAEDSAKEELAASLSYRLKGEAMLRAAADRMSGAQDACRSDEGRTATGEQLMALQSYLESTERARIAAAEDLTRREADVEDRRGKLIAAARERQALERLKERRRADHRLEESRSENAALDEMATALHRRKEALR
ncbi:MAG: flagellar export protein FliJ [Thermoleophilaceae bacterium]